MTCLGRPNLYHINTPRIIINPPQANKMACWQLKYHGIWTTPKLHTGQNNCCPATCYQSFRVQLVTSQTQVNHYVQCCSVNRNTMVSFLLHNLIEAKGYWKHLQDKCLVPPALDEGMIWVRQFLPGASDHNQPLPCYRWEVILCIRYSRYIYIWQFQKLNIPSLW